MNHGRPWPVRKARAWKSAPEVTEAGTLRRSRQGRGFTLVELLVVMAILSLLAGLLLPVLEKAINEARITSCANNLRQVGVGAHLYLADFKSLPLGGLTSMNKNSPKAYISPTGEFGAEFACLAKEYLECPNPDWDRTHDPVDFGILNCPGKRPRYISWGQIDQLSYVTGEMVATYYAQYAHPEAKPNLADYPRLHEDRQRVYGPYRKYYHHPVRPQKSKNPSAWPLLHDEALASGGKANWYNPANHPSVSNGPPRMNAVYGDGSVATQHADRFWFGDCYGRRTMGSTTFASWYMPYIRMDPFPSK